MSESTDQPAAEIAKSTIGEGPGDGVTREQRHGMFGVAGSGDTSGFGGLGREKWIPPPSQRPYGSYFDEVVDNLIAAYPQFEAAVEKVVVDRGELTIYLT